MRLQRAAGRRSRGLERIPLRPGDVGRRAGHRAQVENTGQSREPRKQERTLGQDASIIWSLARFDMKILAESTPRLKPYDWIPAEVWIQALLFFLATLPDDPGARSPPLIFDVVVKWNIPENSKPAKFRVKAIAINGNVASVAKPALTAYVELQVVKPCGTTLLGSPVHFPHPRHAVGLRGFDPQGIDNLPIGWRRALMRPCFAGAGRIGVMRALNRGHIREFNTSPKDPQWGRRKLKRDQ